MRIDRCGIVAALALFACKGSSKQAAPPVARDAAVIVDAPAAVASLGTSTQCVLVRLAQTDGSLPDLAQTWSTPAAAEAAYQAAFPLLTDDDARARALLQLAAERAMNGDLKGARTARTQGMKLVDARTAIIGGRQIAELLGEPPDKQADLDDVPFLVRGGQRDEAERVFAADTAPLQSTGDPAFDRERQLDQAGDLGGALAALGKLDDLEQRLAKATPDVAAAMVHGWLRDAVWSGERLDDAVAAMVTRRAADKRPNGGERDDDLLVLIETASHRGRGPAMAPLLHAIRTKPAKKARRDLLWLLRLAYAVGDDAEAAAVEAEIAAAPVEPRGTDPHPQVALMRAVWRGTLDEAIAAIQAYQGRFAFEVTAAYYGALWARHVSEGADPAFEPRLTAAVCGHPAACLVDDVAWSAVRVGPDGVTVGGKAIAAADLVATLKAGIGDACGVPADRSAVTVLLEPRGRAIDAVAAIHAALDAGDRTVTLRELVAADAPAPTERSCEWTSRGDHDAAVKVQIHRGVTSLITSPDEPAVELDAAADADAIAEAIDGLRTGMMSRTAAAVIDDDVSTEGLARIVFPLCAHYPQVSFD